MDNHANEIEGGQRFEFGKNWSRFLSRLNDERVEGAVKSLQNMLGAESLVGKTFLDIGSGSGLFSLAARCLGARVQSFDYDPQSVACTNELKRRYFPSDPTWVVEEESVLNSEYLAGLGQFDIVYSWGVLHHSGSMWRALELVVPLVNEHGTLFIALYNDQGWISKYWSMIKRMYNKNEVLRLILLSSHIPYLFGGRILVRLLMGRMTLERGMSFWYDMLDWLGGYPFEVVKPKIIEDYFKKQNFNLIRSNYCGNRHGCNEYVFCRVQSGH